MSPRGKPTTVPCPDCGGRGSIPWATSDVKCAACDGTGRVRPAK